MARLRTIHVCTECAASTPKWAGRCPQCGAWNSLVEDVEEVGRSGSTSAPANPLAAATAGVATDMPLPIAEVDSTEAVPRPTGLSELDRVLGGGLVPGSVTLLGGEPGIGKSTLLLQAMAGLCRSGGRGLLVTAEESKQQVRLRADRLGALPLGLWLVAETSLTNIVGALDQVKPDFLVVDSIQTVMDPELGSLPGSVAQVRGCAHRLVQEAKHRDLATVLVGHVNKEGSLAGPRVLEHLVDTVLSFEGERHHALRLLRAVKHRFGPTGELGLFEMDDDGLKPLPDPSGLFLGDRRANSPGSVVVPAMAGHRPLLVELQALVAPTRLPMPRRSTSGLDNGRLGMVTAVLERHCHAQLSGLDIYASVVGGVKVVEPSADLALGLALCSALTEVPLPPDLVACAEVGLAGELRQVGQTSRRLSEAARLGFRRAVVARTAPDAPPDIETIRVGSLAEAALALGVAALAGKPTD